MDLYQLKTFYTLSKLKSYTEAAKTLYVTQSAVSHSIKKLENSLELKLVEKKGKKFELTSAGEVLNRSCEVIFSEIEKATENLSYFKGNHIWELNVGATVEFGTTILVNHIKKFTDENRDININFHFSHNLIERLIKDEVDFIIDCRKHSYPGIEKIELFTEQYVVIASPSFLRKSRIRDLKDLENIKILSLDKKLEWWVNFLDCFKPSELPVFKNIMVINHIRGLINAAKSGIGIGFVPKYTVLNELREQILIDPFPLISPKVDNFIIYIKREKQKLKKNSIFIDYLKNIKLSEFGTREASPL